MLFSLIVFIIFVSFLTLCTHIISIKKREKHICNCHKFEEYSLFTLFIKQKYKSRSIMFFYHFLKCQRRCLISIILHLECYIHQNCCYWYLDMICHVSKKINKTYINRPLPLSSRSERSPRMLYSNR